jgi:hypothetical protein
MNGVILCDKRSLFVFTDQLYTLDRATGQVRRGRPLDGPLLKVQPDDPLAAGGGYCYLSAERCVITALPA